MTADERSGPAGRAEVPAERSGPAGRAEVPAEAGAGAPPHEAATDPHGVAVPGRGGGGSRGWRPRRRTSRRRRLVRSALGLVVLVVVGVVAFYEIEANPLGGPGRAVVVTVTPGEAVGAVLDDLAARGVIGSALAFRLSDLVEGAPQVRPGRYLLHQNLSFGDVRARLAAGPDVFAVTVAPGESLREVANETGSFPGHSARSFLAAAASGSVRSALDPGAPSLEGLLGTGTYELLPGESDTRLLGQMVGRFDRQAAAAGLTPAAASRLGLTLPQVVTVASIVQKEAVIAKNMGPVARVIYNRLARGDALQMDTTVLYALGRDGGVVSGSDLRVQSPYNTYLHPGLPPGPIGVPSAAALRAALDPPPGDWLYFVVVQKDGTEAFVDTYAQQLANEHLAESRGIIP
ncbi:MAG TPA: endolytic transglycosylase MltG [Acidimicrobiales bacterium]|nr:endolytic transglycosylase MltG [Acidimicrobiales bacterium]